MPARFSRMVFSRFVTTASSSPLRSRSRTSVGRNSRQWISILVLSDVTKASLHPTPASLAFARAQGTDLQPHEATSRTAGSFPQGDSVLRPTFACSTQRFSLWKMGLSGNGGSNSWTKINSVKTAWAGTCRRAGTRGLQIRDSRREFASQLRESGASDHDVQDFLGHANITTTSRYLASTPLRLEQALAKLEARNRRTSVAQTADQPRDGGDVRSLEPVGKQEERVVPRGRIELPTP